MTSPSSNEPLLGRETARRLARTIRNFAVSEVGGRAAILAGLLLAFLLGINGLNVVNSYVGRYFMTAIERRDTPEFVRQALLYVAVFAASTIVAVVYRFTEERLALLWRHWLTQRLVGAYLDAGLYYRMNVARTLANPDQRIADDVRSLATGTLSLVLVFLNGTLTILAFSGVLWSISRLLFAVAVGYAAAGSLIAIVLGRPLVRLNYDQSDKEADFRAELVHVRENAESVVMLRRERHLAGRLRGQVEALTENLKGIIAVNRNLGFFTTGYNYMIQIIPVLIVAPLFIEGKAEFGVIPQATMAFAHIVGAFSLVVNQFGQLSSYAAVLARLSALIETAEALSRQQAGGIAVTLDDRRIALDGLTLRTPEEGQVLVRDLSVEVTAGSPLLITGSDLVLTALQRTIAGIWESGEGRIARPRLDDVLLLPDRPYLPGGTLRELLVGSEGSERVADDRLRAALRTVAVDAAVQRVGGLDAERDWDNVLSLDEQRLVSVARVLLAAPRFAVFAHLATSLGAERAVRVLDELAAHGVGAIVLGDGVLPRERFAAVVEIAHDGTWTTSAAAPPRC